MKFSLMSSTPLSKQNINDWGIHHEWNGVPFESRIFHEKTLLRKYIGFLAQGYA